MITVHITSEYLIYIFEIDSYHIMSESTLSQWQRWQQNKRICQRSWPWNSANDNSCEVQPFKPNRVSNCIYKTVIDSSSYWTELEKKSSWLFKVPFNFKVRVQCTNAQIQVLDLPMQGILSIALDCTARTDDRILIVHHNIQSESEEVLSSSYVGGIDQILKVFWDHLKLNSIYHTVEIARLNKEIKYLKENHIKLNDLHFHHNSGHASLGLGLIITIIMVIYAIKKFATRQRLQAITFAGPLQGVL